jgi:hypothetical protein
MASRDFLKHVVSTSEPVGSTLGDEYYNPSSNKLFKRLAVNGTSVQWVERQQSIAVQSSGVTVATGARTINFPGATIGYDSVTDTITIQSSGIPGGANTNIQFNNSGAFAGSGNLTWNNGTQTLALTGFLTTFALSRSGNINAPTWTTTSPVFNSAAALLTDTTGSGTIALKVGHSFLSPNFASSSLTTITDAANLYVNANVASTNTTITNNWALYVAGNQRITGTLFSDADIQLSGSRVVDYKNSTAQWTVNGGGVVTWNGSSVLWNQRILVIPVARSIMGSAGYFEIACPTSGTVTYFNSSNVTTTVTCTAAGIPLASYEALYYELNVGGTNASEQTRFRVVNYLNSTWRPSSGWILLAAVNGDGTNIGHLQWIPGQINLPTTGATVTYNTGTGISSWAAGSGTVTAVSVASANGFAGTSSGGATPALTLTTSITGLLKGNGTAISAAVAGTDYQTAQSVTGIVKSSGTTRSAAVAGTDYVAPSGTFFIGTTSIAHNRASATQSLTGISIDGTAGVGTTVTTTASTTNSAFKIPMLNTTGVAGGNFGLLLDSAAAGDFTFNPSTNTLVVGKLGVGLTAPGSILETEENTTGITELRITNSNNGSNVTKSSRLTFRITDTVGTRKDVAYITAIPLNADSSAGDILTFSTRTADATPTEKVRIDNNGTIGFTVGSAAGIIRRTTVNGSNGIRIQGNTSDTINTDAAAGAYITVGGGVIGDTFEGNIDIVAYGGNVDANRNQIRFSNRSAANTITERVRIDSSGNLILNGNVGGGANFLILRGGTAASAEGAHIVMGYGNNTSSAITGQANNTWNIDVAAGAANNDFRIFRQNSAGATATAISILESNGGTQILSLGVGVAANGTSGDVTAAGYMIQSISATLTAAGTTQGTALLLAKQINNVTTVAANSGVRLPVAVAGMRIIVRNSSATNLNVYPNTGAQIQTLGTNVAMVLIAATMLEYVAVSATQWYLMNNVYA